MLVPQEFVKSKTPIILQKSLEKIKNFVCQSKVNLISMTRIFLHVRLFLIKKT